MSRMKVRLTFNDAQGEIVNQFAREIGLSVDDFCKRAVFYSINDSYKRAELVNQKLKEELDAKNNANVGDNTNATHNSPTGVTESNSAETQVSESTDSAALPDSASTDTDSKE